MTAWVEPVKAVKHPQDKTRRELLQHAVSHVRDTGLRVSLDHINLEALIREVGVPRSTVFRIWQSKEDFLSDLLVELINPEGLGSAAYDPFALDQAEDAITALSDPSDPASLSRAIREAVRVGAKANFDSVIGSVEWQAYMAASLSLPSFPEDQRNKIFAALQTVQANFLGAMTDYYKHLLALAGLSLKPGVTHCQLAAAGSAIVEGLAQRHLLDSELVDRPILVPDPDGGDPVPWHLAAYSFMGLIESFVELP